jgi:hypothetical protein
VAGTLDSAAAALLPPAAKVRRDEAIDANLSLAGRLWRLRGGNCGSPPRDQALEILQGRLGQ